MPIGVGLGPDGALSYVVRGTWCVTAPEEQPLRTTHHAPRTTHRCAVEAVLDSWQLDDEWWRQRISRRYVAVMLEGGKRMLLFEDLVTGEWFEQTP
jgi:hypothetical protein